MRRAEVALGLLLAAVSFAPWWTRRGSGTAASAWTGPHFVWLAVLLCVAVVVGRSLPRPAIDDRWASAATVVALAVAGWGWLSELTEAGDGAHQLAWVLQDQGTEVGPAGGPFDAGWGFTAGLILMGLLLAAFAVPARLRRDR